MKRFNINSYIYVQITEKGWEHLNDTVGHDYVRHCVTPYMEEINDEIWHRLQAHEVFSLLPVGMGADLLFYTNIMIGDESLEDC